MLTDGIIEIAGLSATVHFFKEAIISALKTLKTQSEELQTLAGVSVCPLWCKYCRRPAWAQSPLKCSTCVGELTSDNN